MLFELFHLPATILLSFIVFYYHRKKMNRNIRTLFFIYLPANFIIELIANILDSNIVLYNAAMIFEITLFLLVYYRSMPETWVRKIIFYMIIFFLFFAIMDALLLQEYTTFFSYTYTVGCVLLMFASLYYLFIIVIKYENINPLKNFLFWFSIGVLFCYLGNLPYLSVLNKIISVKNNNLSNISKVVNTLLYLLITIGSICQINTKKSVVS